MHCSIVWTGTVKVAVEYDGRHHINRQDQWTYDIRRREELEAEGWRFLVLTAPDIYRTPGTTLDRAESLLAAGGLRVRRRPDWFAHFPSQPSLSACRVDASTPQRPGLVRADAGPVNPPRAWICPDHRRV